MLYTFEELKHKVYEKIYAVHEIFVNYFGDDYVDLQTETLDNELSHALSGSRNDYYSVPDERIEEIKGRINNHYAIILVYWPSVTVTNEYGRSIDITDLFAKIKINLGGKIPYEYEGFTLNRSSYTAVQLASDYMHSHISHIPTDNFTMFQSPCLGRGPIRGTITTLKIDNSDVFWMMFCEELARYVTVESIAGVPYRRLENVGKKHKSCEFSGFASYRLMLNEVPHYYKDFIKYYLTHGHFRANFSNGMYVCGMGYYDYMVDISNAFIDYYNLKLRKLPCAEEARALLHTVFVANNGFYDFGSNGVSSVEQYVGKNVCTFKGQEYNITIINAQQEGEEETYSLILSQKLAMFILISVLKLINYNFKNGNNREENTSSSSQTVRYL